LFVQPLSQSRAPPYDCTTDQFAPAVDTLFVLTHTASVIYIASRDNLTNKEGVMMASFLAGVVWGVSAIYGYGETRACAEVLARQEEPDQVVVRPRRSRPAPVSHPRPIPAAPAPAASTPDGAGGVIWKPAPAEPRVSTTPAAPPAPSAPPDAGTAGPPPPAPDAAPPVVPTAPAIPQQPDEEEPRQRRRHRS
jgi:hypothetical protein